MRWVGMLLAVTAAVGCSSVRLHFQSLPADEALRAIEPGVTTRSEVIRRLGPPEEMRRLSPFERGRTTSPQERRVLEAGEVFGTRVYTYASSTRSIESVGILPVGPPLFRVSWERSHERRWSIEFDDDDVVASVSQVDEADAAR